MHQVLGVCPLAAIVAAAGALTTTAAQASAVYRLDIFTANGGYYDDPGIMLEVEVSEESGLARFDFRNESTVTAVIEGIYLEQGALDSLHSLIDGPGTAFSWPATPANLPAGQMLDPLFSTWFSADADPPAPTSGINPGETLAVRFNLADGATIDDVYGYLDSAALRVGAHVIALPDGSSESAATPEPATMALLLGSTALAVAFRRRRSFRQG